MPGEVELGGQNRDRGDRDTERNQREELIPCPDSLPGPTRGSQRPRPSSSSLPAPISSAGSTSVPAMPSPSLCLRTLVLNKRLRRVRIKEKPQLQPVPTFGLPG